MKLEVFHLQWVFWSSFLRSALLFAIGSVLLIKPASADGEAVSRHPTVESRAEQPRASANYGKERSQFLAGEEVVTPTGQRMKVWSTDGPVAVSPPPEPFGPRQNTIKGEVDVFVNGDAFLPERRPTNPLEGGGSGPGRSSGEKREGKH